MTKIEPIVDDMGFTGCYIDTESGHTFNNKQDVIDAVGYNPFEDEGYETSAEKHKRLYGGPL